MRIDRMLAITVMMLNRDRVMARELAEKFDVSVRTVYRDLDAIHLAGIPIVSYSGNKGGYGIMDTFRIDRQFLTFNDIVAMVSALRGVNTALENRELDTAIEKITSLVPGHQTDQLKKYFEQVVIDILPMGYTRKQKDVFQEVHRAVVQERLLKVIYRNNKGETKQRTIEPMTVIFKGYAWYLFAFCRLRDDYRLFRLSRISKPRVSEEKFERRERSYREIFISDDDKVKMVSLKLKFSPRARTRVEDFFEEKQIEYKKDGTMIVRVTFPEDVWVYATLLSYGEDVEILDPPHIRSLIQEKANKIIEIYQSDSTK